ncbi:PIN/TRAM domain-containing protein [Corticicoccus populi]|uniref:PIN/TRAM domain-containing protein n=1 Tax=Corticicoccus populi TaxID=1812821 RepID=A0ABW5WW62_9STAP
MLRYLLYVLYFIIGLSLGVWLLPSVFGLLPLELPELIDNVFVYAFIGGVLFLALFFWSVDQVEKLIRKGEGVILNRSIVEITFATLGMIIGLVIAVLISLLLNTLNIPLISDIVSFVLAVVLGYLGFQIGMKKYGEVLDLFQKPQQKAKEIPAAGKKFLDTSAIIDGRIVDVVKTGFIDGELIVPQFVLDELQLIADSTDSIKRDRGQRGLDMLNQLQTLDDIQVMPVKYDKLDVDQQLIQLAKAEKGAIITTDFNLNRVCQVHNIKVLNVNELSDAIKLLVVQGDVIDILVTKYGKEEGQGVGYLDDGTMVVIEDGRHLINKNVRVEVTSVLQTNSGRIIFSRKES